MTGVQTCALPISLNEQLGIQSRKQLPHEYLKEYDETLRAAINQTLNEGEGRGYPLGRSESGNQHARVTPELTRQREAELNPSPKDKSDNVTSNRKKTDESISNPPKETTPGLTDRKLDEETEAQRKKVRRTMREYKKGKLHSGSKKGKKVTSREQAIAIALNQAGLSKNQVNESAQAILEEIQNNLQEQFVYIYENYDESVMEQFLASLKIGRAHV